MECYGISDTLAVNGSQTSPNGGKKKFNDSQGVGTQVFEKPLSNKCEGFYVSDTRPHGNIRIFAKIDV